MSKPDHDAIDAALTAEQMWQEILDKDDRNSPSEYPEMAMLTFDEFKGYIKEAAIVPAGASAAGAARDMREAARQFAFDQTCDHPEYTGNWNDACEHIANGIAALPLPAPQPDQRDDLRALLVRAGEAMEAFASAYERMTLDQRGRAHTHFLGVTADFRRAYDIYSAIRTATQTQETEHSARIAELAKGE